MTASIVALARHSEGNNTNLYGLTWGTLHGYSDDENFQKKSAVFIAFQREGGTAAILKKFPIPEENAASPKEDK